MTNRESPRTLVERALSKCRNLIDPESYSGFTVHSIDMQDIPKEPEALRRWMKEKLRLYVTTWIIPDLELAITKLTKPKRELP